MSKIYPDSVNTYRIVTVTRNGNPGVVYAFIRIGNGKVMDNVDWRHGSPGRS